jgi:hypothetical protein
LIKYLFDEVVCAVSFVVVRSRPPNVAIGRTSMSFSFTFQIKQGLGFPCDCFFLFVCDDTDEDVERLLQDDESISDIVLSSCSKRASNPIFILYISPIRGFFVNNPIKKPIRGDNCFSLSFSVSYCN